MSNKKHPKIYQLCFMIFFTFNCLSSWKCIKISTSLNFLYLGFKKYLKIFKDISEIKEKAKFIISLIFDMNIHMQDIVLNN